jgi:DNA repair photolyase
MPRKRKPTEDERIVLGKICGCGKCKYCYAWQHEQTMQAMLDQVRQGKEIAEAARQEWIDQHINRS